MTYKFNFITLLLSLVDVAPQLLVAVASQGQRNSARQEARKKEERHLLVVLQILRGQGVRKRLLLHRGEHHPTVVLALDGDASRHCEAK